MTVKEFAAQMFCTLRSQTIEDWEKMPEKAKKSFETLAGYTLSIVGSDENEQKRYFEELRTQAKAAGLIPPAPDMLN